MTYKGASEVPRPTVGQVCGTHLAPVISIPLQRGDIPMPKYGSKARQKVRKAMRERKRGTLRSGRSGKKVTSRKQAIAIGLSEARRAGGKVPRKKRRKK
jgi:hypothetical protein